MAFANKLTLAIRAAIKGDRKDPESEVRHR